MAQLPRLASASVSAEEGPRALGVTLVAYPVAASTHLPAVHAAEIARRAAQEADGAQETPLSLAKLGVLAHALATGMPVLTDNLHQVTLTCYGLNISIHQHIN